MSFSSYRRPVRVSRNCRPGTPPDAGANLASDLASCYQLKLNCDSQIILGVINALIDSCIIWQCYYYSRFAQLKRIRRLLQGGRQQRPPHATRPPMSSDPENNDIHASASPSTQQGVIRQPSVAIPPAKSIPFTLPAHSKWRSIGYHMAFIALVVGVSIMVWGVAVERLRKTSSLKDGEDGTDPKYSPAGATFGWISMVIYSELRLSSP